MAFELSVAVGVVAGGLFGGQAIVDSVVVVAAGAFLSYLLIEGVFVLKTRSSWYYWAPSILVALVLWIWVVLPPVRAELLCSDPVVSGVHISDSTPDLNRDLTLSISTGEDVEVDWSSPDGVGDIVGPTDMPSVTYRPSVTGNHILEATLTAACGAKAERQISITVTRE